MENISSSYGITSKWVRDDDPLYPCPVVAERHKLYCYLMVTSRILPLMNWDFAKTADWCRKSERRWVGMCFQSFGRDASGTTRGNIPRILEICGFARGLERECIFGAARDLVNTDTRSGRAAGLCRRAAADLQEYCYEGIGTILSGLYATRSERRKACDAVSRLDAFTAACRVGAGAGP
jgi:hypothetical protein